MDTYRFGVFSEVGRLHRLCCFARFELDIIDFEEIRCN